MNPPKIGGSRVHPKSWGSHSYMGRPGTPKVGGPLRVSYGTLGDPRVDQELGGAPQKLGVSLRSWGSLSPSGPQKSGSLWFMGWPGFTWTPIWGPPSFMGCPGPPGTPPPPKAEGPALIWGALDPHEPPQNRGSLVHPESWGSLSYMGGPGPTCTPKVGVPLFYGVARDLMDPKFGAPPPLWGAQDPHEPPPRKLRVPLLYGAPWDPKSRGSPPCFLWDFGGRSCRSGAGGGAPKVGGLPPFMGFPETIWTPKVWGPSGLWGGPGSHGPQIRGSPSFMGCPGPP